jgi:homocysteine S-methyltransferase
MSENPLAPILDARSILLVDGGLATTLEARGHVLDRTLWSAGLLLSDPAAIRDAHTAFLEAGVDCIVTAAYQASFPGFAAAGLTDGEAVAALERSSALALEARNVFAARCGTERGSVPLVAASVGPYGAHLADGSEYHGRYGIERTELEAFHRRRLHILADSGVDLLACETIPSRAEADVLLGLLAEHGKTWAWMSFTCADGARLRDGSDFEAAVRACAAAERMAAVGVNCTDPRHLPELTRRARGVTDLPVVVYANSGEVWNAEAGDWQPAPRDASWQPPDDPWLAGTRAAYAEGARALGGCCRIGPERIAMLRRALVGGD